MIKPLMERSPYFLMILLVSCYDIIMKLSEFIELSENYIAEMPVKIAQVYLPTGIYPAGECYGLKCLYHCSSKV